MRKFNKYEMTGASVADKKVIMNHLRREVELYVNEIMQVWNEGGQYIADAISLSPGCGIEC